MSLETLAWICAGLAALPGGLFLMNLLVYRPTGRSQVPSGRAVPAMSVLIPARNEAANLPSTLDALRASRGVEFEVVVMDDHSTDDTAGIVNRMAARDPRVRIESAPPLPPGWCGKQHACCQLARRAQHPLLVFLDADVRLGPDALARMGTFIQQRGVALVSGVPHQELGSFGERLLLPLIHFVLLGFLPMPAMRWSRWPALGAGCGQLFVARAEAYHGSGGHASIAATLHDGINLPKAFRRAGFKTDLFDATDLATCRMYKSSRETWRGLGKNAIEGLGAPGTIVPMTVLLIGGQVLPFVLLPLAVDRHPQAVLPAVIAVLLAYLPRLIAAFRFRQPWVSVCLHPFGILALLVLQWQSLGRHLLGRPSIWKDRPYASPTIKGAG
jgi:hypothetical protein